MNLLSWVAVIILSLIIYSKISKWIDKEYKNYIFYSKGAYDEDQGKGCLVSIILAVIIVSAIYSIISSIFS